MRDLLRRWWSLNKLVLFLFTLGSKAQTFQNLVPNGSFETYTQCPDNSSQIYHATPWTGPGANSTDYLNACSSVLNVPYYGGTANTFYYLNARNGNAYSGLYVYSPQDYREYLQVQLIDSLDFGVCYYLEWYSANAQYVPFCVNNIAAHFSSTFFSTSLTPTNSLLNVNPHITSYNNPILQDTVKWTKIAGIYKAQGHEKFLTIGNFKNNALTDTMRLYPIGTGPIFAADMAYIFIDAVSIYSLDPHGTLPWSYRDTIMNEGDSVFIGNQMGGLNFHPKWYKEDGTFITTNAGITVKPEITSKYVVQFTLCGVPHSDTVEVKVIPRNSVALKEFEKWTAALKIYPQPATDFLNFESELITEGESFEISLKNNLGQLVKSETLTFKSRKASLNIADLPAGVYLVIFKTQNNERITKKMVVAR